MNRKMTVKALCGKEKMTRQNYCCMLAGGVDFSVGNVDDEVSAGLMEVATVLPVFVPAVSGGLPPPPKPVIISAFSAL